uniref:DUF3313 domain-containing protein n=1 Tax=Steinernema glaseri TaxID=37863 RepID=A0A1I8AD99_9BILA
PGLSAREPHRLHHRRARRGIRPGGHLRAAADLPAADRSRPGDHGPGADAVRQAAGRQPDHDLLRIRVRQYRYGERPVARGGRAAALHQLWRNFARDAAVSVWGFDVDPHAPQMDRAGLNKVNNSMQAMRGWVA